MKVHAPPRRARQQQPAGLQARVSLAEHEYLEDLAHRLDTTISGALRVAIGLALHVELRFGEVEPVEQEEESELTFEDALGELLQKRSRSDGGQKTP